MTGALNEDAGLSPMSFVAVTAQVYASPLDSPETVMGEVELVSKDNVSPKQ